MSVFSNVITPQGLEPLQFPTKFRSHSNARAPILITATVTVDRLLSQAGGAPVDGLAITSKDPSQFDGEV